MKRPKLRCLSRAEVSSDREHYFSTVVQKVLAMSP